MARLWLVRHALVEENARAKLYGTMDVEVCPHGLIAAVPTYKALARRLPQPAQWLITPLSRTLRTAEAIFKAGYPRVPLVVEPGLIEQNLGEWQGLPHAELPGHLTMPAHAFWPLGGEEQPPGGESVAQMIRRVGLTLERMRETHAGQDVVAVSHGGAIRAAVAHALRIPADSALHLSVQNLALTCLEYEDGAWRVGCVNELLGV